MFVRTYFTAVDFDQNDIMLHDKHDAEWRRLEPYIKHKQLGDRKKVRSSFQNFAKAIRIAFALVYKRNNFKSNLLRKLAFPACAIWYFLLDERAQKRCIQHHAELTIHSASEVLSFLETPGIK